MAVVVVIAAVALEIVVFDVGIAATAVEIVAVTALVVATVVIGAMMVCSVSGSAASVAPLS